MSEPARTAADPGGVIWACHRCGQRNRAAFARLDRAHRCGRCQATLAGPSSPVAVATAAVFDGLVGQDSLPVLVDFWAPWCAPCRVVAPELERVAARSAGRLVVAKVNTDELAVVGARLAIRSIPTLAIFRAGRELGRLAGARPAAEIERFVTDTLQAGSRPS